LHSISLAELETLGQQRWPQQAAARGHNIEQAILSTIAVQRQQVRPGADAASQLSSGTRRNGACPMH